MPQNHGRVRRVVMFGNPALRRQAQPVDEITADFRRFVLDLKRTMTERDGLGLAANQVGEPVSVFVLDPRGADVDAAPYCVINPVVTATEGAVEREEGCLSLPALYDVISRPELVRITGLDENGKPVQLEETGLLARAFMHETDHLKGVLFIDHLSSLRRDMLADRLKEIEECETAACR